MTDPNATDAPPACYRHPDRGTWVRCQRCERPICPACQVPAAVGVQCPECVRGSRPAPRPGGWTRAFIPRRSGAVTYILMGLIVVAYVLQWVTGQWLTVAGVLDPRVVGAQPWRLVTSAFLHSPASILHILFNLYALYILGPGLESFLGRARFIALYLLAAVGGSLGVLATYHLWIVTNGAIVAATGGLVQPNSALGASGAVFGLMGAYLALRRAIGVDIGQLLIVIGINVVIGFVAPNIAWEAHFGGLAIGFLVALVYLRTRRPDQRRTQVIGVAAIGVGLLVLFGVFVGTAPILYGL